MDWPADRPEAPLVAGDAAIGSRLKLGRAWPHGGASGRGAPTSGPPRPHPRRYSSVRPSMSVDPVRLRRRRRRALVATRCAACCDRWAFAPWRWPRRTTCLEQAIATSRAAWSPVWRCAPPAASTLQEELRRRGVRSRWSRWSDTPKRIRGRRGRCAAAPSRCSTTPLSKPTSCWHAVHEALALDAERRAPTRRAGRRARSAWPRSRDKERDVLRMIVAGRPNKAMANHLGASLRTVENRRREVFTKLGVRQRRRAGDARRCKAEEVGRIS